MTASTRTLGELTNDELSTLHIAHAGTNRAFVYLDALRDRLAATLSVHERFVEEDRLRAEARARYYGRLDAAIDPSEHIANRA